MKNLGTKQIVLGAVVGLGLVIGALLLFGRDDPVEKKFRALEMRPYAGRDIDDSVLNKLKMKDLGEGAYAYDGDLTFEQIVALLRKRFGAHIQNGYVQISMIEELVRHLQKKYPDSWVERLQEILGAAFPDLGAHLFKMSEGLYKLNKYQEQNRDTLTRMSDEDRRKALWDVRRDLFGDKADEIFAGVKKQERVADSLKAMQGDKNRNVREKLQTFQKTLEEAYGKELPSIMKNRQQTMINNFIDAVQEDLGALPPAQRKEALTDIRKGLGLDDLAISRWDDLDNQRDQRWSNGNLYMAERKEIISKYGGSEREQKLEELRRRLFNDEAESIKNEEASGFMRFERGRRFGRE